MRKRDFLILLDHVHGKTYESIAAEHGISPQRVHQVCVATISRLGLRTNASKEDIGLAIQRAHCIMDRIMDGAGTPEWFYGVLREERAEDERLSTYCNL